MKSLRNILTICILALASANAFAAGTELSSRFDWRHIASAGVTIPATDVNYSDSFGGGLFQYTTDANGCRKVYHYAYNTQGFIVQFYNLPLYSGGVCFPFNRTGVNLYNPYNQESTYLALDYTNSVRFWNSSGFPSANLIWSLPTEYFNDSSTGPDMYFEIVTSGGNQKTVFSLYDVVYTAFPYGLCSVEASGDWLMGQP